MSSKPWHFLLFPFNFFFIFNSYSHTHSNLKRASSIPKLFFSHIYFFLILSFAPIPPQYFTLFKFTSSKPCLFFTCVFFSSTSSIPVFFSFFSLFCSYVLHYNLHTSHVLKTWVRLPGLLFFFFFFLHIFYFTCSLLQLFFLHLKFFFYYTFFFPFIHYSIIITFFLFFYSFLSFTQINS